MYSLFDPDQMPGELLLTLGDKLISWAESRQPDFVIGEEAAPYLRRWHLQRDGKKGCVYLHHIIRDDDDRAMHDHPWDSTSIVLRGTMTEICPHFYASASKVRLPSGQSQHVRLGSDASYATELAAGSITTRKAEHAHRLVVSHGEVWTLFITGPHRREWGFHCRTGWKHWTQFVRENAPGQRGAGCAEGEENV